jgi:glyoxylase I family protein
MSAPAVRKDVHRFFHINVNCTDFDRSVAFYEAVGFEIVLDFDNQPGPRRSFGEIGLAPILRLPEDADARACLMALQPEDLSAPRLDLLEWKSPVEPAERRRNLAQPGVARICLKTFDADAVHDRLAALGYEPYTRPILIQMGPSNIKVFCCEDPDGVVIEFMEFLRD